VFRHSGPHTARGRCHAHEHDLGTVQREHGSSERVPGVFANQESGPAPGGIECTELQPRLYIALLVEHAVGGQKILPVNVQDVTALLVAEPYIDRTVVERIPPLLVESGNNVQCDFGVATRTAPGGIEISGQRSGSDGRVEYTSLEEVSREGGLGQVKDVRPVFSSGKLREQLFQASQSGIVVRLYRPDLRDSKVGHT